jgi:hypothetical protein
MPAQRASLPAKLTVDFTGVEVKKGADYVPPGDYLVQIVGCELRDKKDDPTRKYLSWRVKVLEPEKYAGKTLFNRTSLVRESLWNLRSWLVDMLGEANVPQKAVDIPLAKIVEKKPIVGVTVDDDEYNGKTQSKIVGSFSRADWANLKGSAEESESSDEATETADEDSEDLDEIDVDDI